MEFPLYNSLSQAAETATFNKELFKRRLQVDAPDLPECHRKVIFMLVLHHWLLNNPKKSSKGLPYGSKPCAGGKGIIQKFPEDFAPILAEYFNRIAA